jgi:hypothetical protein
VTNYLNSLHLQTASPLELYPQPTFADYVTKGQKVSWIFKIRKTDQGVSYTTVLLLGSICPQNTLFTFKGCSNASLVCSNFCKTATIVFCLSISLLFYYISNKVYISLLILIINFIYHVRCADKIYLQKKQSRSL